MYKKYIIPLPSYGMWGSRKTSWDSPANNKKILVLIYLIHVSTYTWACSLYVYTTISMVYQVHQFVCKVEDFREVSLDVFDQELEQSRLVVAVFGARQLKMEFGNKH